MVLSFILIGFFLSNIVTEQITKTKQTEMKKQAERLIEIAQTQPQSNNEINDYDKVSLKQMWIKKGEQTFYKSPAINEEGINKVMEPWLTTGKTGFYRFTEEESQAVLVYRKEGYTVYLVDRLTDLKGLTRSIWEYLLLTMMTAIPIVFFIVRYIYRSYIAPIKEVTYASKLLTEGNYKVRIPESTVTKLRSFISAQIDLHARSRH
ncbi:hypothetical protein [Macrococcus hajekii]|uniref:hypothetical protein n=1 Tax=Macrococcus hajekii TaxID=198482 RepID=UPI001E4C7227|nr:hypothetical protein [Macrococcus hajekii]